MRKWKPPNNQFYKPSFVPNIHQSACSLGWTILNKYTPLLLCWTFLVISTSRPTDSEPLRSFHDGIGSFGSHWTRTLGLRLMPEGKIRIPRIIPKVGITQSFEDLYCFCHLHLDNYRQNQHTRILASLGQQLYQRHFCHKQYTFFLVEQPATRQKSQLKQLFQHFFYWQTCKASKQSTVESKERQLQTWKCRVEKWKLVWRMKL